MYVSNAGRLLAIRIFAISWIVIIYLSVCSQIVKADAEQLEIDFQSDPWFDDYNVPVNIDNATASDTVIGEWERDFGTDIPNGTYYGTLLPPGLFHFEYKSEWIHIEQDGLWYHPDRPGEYGNLAHYIMLTSHFNLSSQKIMSGTSEFWVRLPVHPDSIEPEYGVSIAIFKDQTNIKAPYLESQMSYYRLGLRNLSMDVHGTNGFSAVPSDCEVFPTIGGYTPDNIIRIRELPGVLGGTLRTGSGFNYLVTSDHVYVRVDAVLEPSTDYLFSVIFRHPRESKLYTYWSTAESPAGRETGIYFAQVFHSWNTGVITAYVDSSDVINFSLDLDWSFIFTQGVGMGGLFGKRLEIEKGDSILIRPYFNLTDDEKYMSFMIPMVSDDDLNIAPRVWQGVVPHETFLPPVITFWNFTDGSYWFNNTIDWEYHDFVLFSTSQTINSTDFGLNNSWNVAVELLFNSSANVTLLCYKEDRVKVTWASLNHTGWANQSTNPFFRNEFWDNGSKVMSSFHFNVYCSGRGTDGQWAIRNGTPSTGFIYTHYFPREIHLSSAQWEVVNESASADAMTYYELAIYHWNHYSIGHRLKAIWYAIRAAIQEIWNGAKKFGGYLRDGLHNVWDSMKRFGSWIYTKIVEFVGKIWNFIDNVIDTIAGFWESFQYIIAPIAMIIIITGGGTVAKKMLQSKGS